MISLELPCKKLKTDFFIFKRSDVRRLSEIEASGTSGFIVSRDRLEYQVCQWLSLTFTRHGAHAEALALGQKRKKQRRRAFPVHDASPHTHTHTHTRLFSSCHRTIQAHVPFHLSDMVEDQRRCCHVPTMKVCVGPCWRRVMITHGAHVVGARCAKT
ncbi:hypothetical protein L7F22_014589 [Adiantum nelumboides]|nr:hypothetical protein [Adiantum nelumboides]